MAWTERYVRADAAGGGDGTTNTNSGANGAWTFDEAITNAAAGQRINIKSGTYSYSAVKTIANAGSATTPIWWRGFNSTIGDLDSATAETNFPVFAFSGAANYFAISSTAAFNWFSCLKVSSAVTTSGVGCFYINAPNCRAWKIHSTGTAADADCKPIWVGSAGDNSIVACCYGKNTNTTSGLAIMGGTTNAPAMFIGNYCEGGERGIVVSSNSTVCFNVINNPATYGILLANVSSWAHNNSVYSAGTAGIYVSATILCGAFNNILSECGIGIDAASGSETCLMAGHNLYHGNSTDVGNLFEDYEFGGVTDASSPFVDAAGGDFRIKSTSNGKGAGLPGFLLSLSTTGNGYLDIGALQLGSGGLLRHPGMSGGLSA